MEVDTFTESSAAADPLTGSPGDFSVGSDDRASASEGLPAEEPQKIPIYSLKEVPRKSLHPASTIGVPQRSQRRFTGLPEKKRSSTFFETHPRRRRSLRCLNALGRVAMKERYSRAAFRCTLDTLFEIPFVTADNQVIFSKTQKLRRSVDEVDQLMMNLDLRNENHPNHLNA